jgi:citrate lyase subunit gamma (acyl carrier protein)
MNNMIVRKTAKAGTLESNDIFIMVSPSSTNGIELNLQSIVLAQFGRQIREKILETVAKRGVTQVAIFAQDRGALDYTIEARVETALDRAFAEEEAVK